MAKFDWDQHRSEIERLYCTEQKTLDEVMSIMKDSSGFRASKASYERKLKQWKVKKNRKQCEWRAISRKVARRKHLLGRASEVFLGANLCSQAKLQKEFARHDYMSTMYKLRSLAYFRGHIDTIAWSLDSPVEWNVNVPWLQCRRWIEKFANQVSHDRIKTQPSSVVSLIAPGATFTSSLQDLIAGIGASLPWSNSNVSTTVQSSSRITAFLSMIMPEEHAGQIGEAVERLCGIQNDEALSECFMLQLFLLSNNFTPWDTENGVDIDECMRNHDDRIIQILRSPGPRASSQFYKCLLQANGDSPRAIAEQLFASVVRSGDLELLQVMLETGADPKQLIETPTSCGKRISSLEAVATLLDSVSTKATTLLLNACSRNNRKESVDAALSAALEEAIKRRNRQLVDRLIDYGATILPNASKNAVHAQDDIILRRILDAGADPNATFCHWQDAEMTAIGFAAYLNATQMIQVLLEYGADIEARQYHVPGCVITPIGMAASQGNIESTKILLEAHALVESPDTSCIYPLRLACSERNSEVITALLDAGASVRSADARTSPDPTSFSQLPLVELLIRSYSRDYGRPDTKIWRSLLAQGARVTPITLRAAVQRGYDVEVISLLVSHGAIMNDNSGRSALQSALLSDQVEVARILVSAGASLPDGVINIRSMAMACFLKEAGLFDDILTRDPPLLIARAIQRSNWAFTEWLLEHDIELNFPHCFDSKEATPLGAAFGKGKVTLAKRLVKRGAFIAPRIVQSAIRARRMIGGEDGVGFALETVRSSHAAWSWLQSHGCSAFDTATDFEDEDSVGLLLDAGIDPRGRPKTLSLPHWDPEEREGREGSHAWREESYGRPVSVLDTAAIRGQPEILRMLLGAVQWKRHCTGSALIQAICWLNFDLAQPLLDAGAAPDQICGKRGVLQSAIRYNRIHLMKDLIQAGANVNKPTRGRFARTPLQVAAEIGSWESTELLLEANADVNAPATEKCGATALQLATGRGYLRIAHRLLDAGAEINAQGAALHGRTALESAAENGRIDMLHLLTSRGAQIDGDGRLQYVRSIMFAESRGHNAAAMLLKSHGGWGESDSIRYAEAQDDSEGWSESDDGTEPDSDHLFDTDLDVSGDDSDDQGSDRYSDFDADIDILQNEPVSWEDAGNDVPNQAGILEDPEIGTLDLDQNVSEHMLWPNHNEIVSTEVDNPIGDSTDPTLGVGVDAMDETPFDAGDFLRLETNQWHLMDPAPETNFGSDIMMPDWTLTGGLDAMNETSFDASDFLQHETDQRHTTGLASETNSKQDVVRPNWPELDGGTMNFQAFDFDFGEDFDMM